MRQFRVIDSCPCPAEAAAQVYMVLRKAGQTASSIYRGADAASVLHQHGKHTQVELYWLSLHGTRAERIAAGLFPGGGGVNPPGRSEHELKSDGVGKAGPVGRQLPDWEVGVDSGQNTPADREAIERAARAFGWKVVHNYGAGNERHHWSFAEPPRARTPWQKARIALLLCRLPKS